MVVYPQPGSGALAAVYFDNEGHVIRYEASAAHEGTVVLLSEAAGGGPRYRLTYAQLGVDRVRVTFEVAPPGGSAPFTTYLEGESRRVRP